MNRRRFIVGVGAIGAGIFFGLKPELNDFGKLKEKMTHKEEKKEDERKEDDSK